MTILDRFLGRTPQARKAVGGPGVLAYNNPSLSSLTGGTWQERSAKYLAAYKVGWFYKAGARLSRDFANLDWTLAYEDDEGDNEEEITAAPGNVPFEQLDPLQQFLRLAERPNPYQTGRELRQKQMIRHLFTGRCVYYLENGAGGGLPTALYGITPSRMTPARDKRGVLVGWVMDADSRDGGTPFSLDEILVVDEAGPEEDPQGVVEAVWQQVHLSEQLPRHTSDVLATGGRLAGMLWPKERSLSDDEFTDAQRAWRNVTSDPNAARRLLIFPEPMEYSTGAATPEQIGLPELARLSREEILSAFPISETMLQLPMAAGLNSGESMRYVRELYWEGSVHPRVEVFEDAFQAMLLPRYETAVGRPLDFDIEEPDLDDAAAIIQKADAMDKLVALGFDPKESAAAVGLDHIEYSGPPEPEPLPEMPPQPEMVQAPQEPVQAQPKAVKASREDVVGESLPGFKATMAAFLADQQRRVSEAIVADLGKVAKSERKAAPVSWWDAEAEDRALREALRPLYGVLARKSLQDVADEVNAIVSKPRVRRVTEKMLDRAGTRITAINETTRTAVAEQVAEGLRRGYSVMQVTQGVPAEGFAGVQGATVFEPYRSELIARTETMLAYNQSSLEGYREFGIEQFEVFDGDEDDACAARDGDIVDGETMAAYIEAEHPNGTLDFAPVWTDKAQHDPAQQALDFAYKALELAARPLPAPVVTIERGAVEVTVETAPPALVEGTTRIEYDADGRIAAIVEGSAQ